MTFITYAQHTETDTNSLHKIVAVAITWLIHCCHIHIHKSIIYNCLCNDSQSFYFAKFVTWTHKHTVSFYQIDFIVWRILLSMEMKANRKKGNNNNKTERTASQKHITSLSFWYSWTQNTANRIIFFTFDLICLFFIIWFCSTHHYMNTGLDCGVLNCSAVVMKLVILLLSLLLLLLLLLLQLLSLLTLPLPTFI